jgi:hypothetical protein
MKQTAKETGNSMTSLRQQLLSFIAGTTRNFPQSEFTDDPFLPLDPAGQNLFQLLQPERFSEIPFIWEKPLAQSRHPETGQTVFHYGAQYGFLQYCPAQHMSLEAMEERCYLWTETPLEHAIVHRTIHQVPTKILAQHIANGGNLLVDIALSGLLGQVTPSLQTPEAMNRRCTRSGMTVVQGAAKGKCLKDVVPQYLIPTQLQAAGAEGNAYELAAESGCLDQLSPRLLTFAAMATFSAYGQNPAQLAAISGNLEQVPHRFWSRLLFLAQEEPDPRRQKYLDYQPLQGFGGNLAHCAAVGEALNRFPEKLQSDKVFDQPNADGNLVMHLAAMRGCLHQIHPQWITTTRLTTRNHAERTVLGLCSTKDLEFLLQVPGLEEKCANHAPKDWWDTYCTLHDTDRRLQNPAADIEHLELF